MYKDLFSCKGKIAVVTGGAGLIGSQIVKGFLDFGAYVYIADKDEKLGQKLAKDTGAVYAFLDIVKEESIRGALSKVVKKSGKIDILVNCAYPRTKDWGLAFEKFSFDSFKSNLNSHLGGYTASCRLAAEHMKRKKAGSIINLSSIYGITAPDFSIYEGTKMTLPAAYAVIKGGVVNLTRYIATYYAKYNIRANAISPGGIFNNQDERFVKKYSKRTPLGRMGIPEDVVGAAIYLASDASRYVTGSNLVVDGGWTIW